MLGIIFFCVYGHELIRIQIRLHCGIGLDPSKKADPSLCVEYECIQKLSTLEINLFLELCKARANSVKPGLLWKDEWGFLSLAVLAMRQSSDIYIIDSLDVQNSKADVSVYERHPSLFSIFFFCIKKNIFVICLSYALSIYFLLSRIVKFRPITQCLVTRSCSKPHYFHDDRLTLTLPKCLMVIF